MQVRFFNESISKFLDSLDKPTFTRTLKTIDLLKMFEYRLGLPHSKKIDKDFFELRIRGKKDVRIFYAFHQKQIILLHCFVKKAQSIPAKEMRVALQRLKRLTV